MLASEVCIRFCRRFLTAFLGRFRPGLLGAERFRFFFRGDLSAFFCGLFWLYSFGLALCGSFGSGGRGRRLLLGSLLGAFGFFGKCLRLRGGGNFFCFGLL